MKLLLSEQVMSCRIDWVEEGATVHDDDDDGEDNSDEEYLPPISMRMGGALKGAPLIDDFPTIGIDETVHDLPVDEVPSDEPLSIEQSILSEPQKVIKEDDIIGIRAALIYVNCLEQLVSFLTLPVDRCTGVLRSGQVCDSAGPFQTNITVMGTAMSIEWDTYCVDMIKEFWVEKRSEAISQLQGKNVVVLDDGRNDSPGHSAQYCSYTTMELESKEIIHVATVNKRQTKWNSNIMEKEGFIQTVDKLSKEIKLVEFCTDAHVQIGALLISGRKYNKNARRYSLYALKCDKSYDYIWELQAWIVKGRVESDAVMPWKTPLRLDDPRTLGVVPPVPPPSTSELVRTQVSRGLGSAFHSETNLEAD
ncbi:hypothetical protein ABVT39_019032 [Epinephelus coioides]